MRSPFRVCVYCGSRPGSNPAFMRSAQQMGAAIGQRGWQLVYGGGRVGLMGALADAALAAGAEVDGVIPHSLMQREVGHHRHRHLRRVVRGVELAPPGLPPAPDRAARRRRIFSAAAVDGAPG
ncbi:MAG TPA: hypothetical protein VIY30_15370 [Burkholderiaceae bacterium]